MGQPLVDLAMVSEAFFIFWLIVAQSAEGLTWAALRLGDAGTEW
jgi:hypothetical protein